MVWNLACAVAQRRKPTVFQEIGRHDAAPAERARRRPGGLVHAWPPSLTILGGAGYVKYMLRIFFSAAFIRLWAAALEMPKISARVSRLHLRGVS